MVEIKTEKEIKIMREGGKILAKIFKKLKKQVKAGTTTLELEKLAKKLILKAKAQCAFLGYEGFPACLCTSVNEEIVHCLPSNRILKEGDLLKLDLGLIWQGYNLDMAETIGVGRISPLAKKLIKVGKKALKIGISHLKVGKKIGEVGFVIERYVKSQGFEVIRELTGHGIGKKLHEEPKIPNFGKREEGIEIKEGMVLCLEPMISAGHWKLEKTKDGFGYKTLDNSLTCHFERTIAITKRGPKILTK